MTLEIQLATAGEIMDSVSAQVLGQEVAPSARADSKALEEAIGRTQAYLLQQQALEGYWVAELESDVTVTAGYIPLMRFMGIAQPERERRIVSFLGSQQLPDGGWSSYWGGPGNLNVSVQTYFALKLAGVQAEEAFMQRARAFILSKGGVSKTHTFTKILIALFGQFDWRGLPSLPPELILLPNWFPFTIYEFASWARATIVDLMVILTKKPVCPVPESAGIFELYTEPRDLIDWSLPKAEKRASWQEFFVLLDRLFKLWEALPVHPGRERALQRAVQWIREHQEADGSWGGIMLPWVYSLIALKSVGYPLDHPVIAKGLAGLERFIVEEESVFRLQPAVSPVWDTALTTIALSDSGLNGDHPALVRAARWLMQEQILSGGDWQVKNPHTDPGAWAFEFDNDLYPDVDDTAMVLLALMRVELPEEGAKGEAIGKALQWILSMQSRDGGWAAFDRDNDMRILAKIPYADFMTPLDPTSVDVTARVVEFLARLGDRRNQAPCQEALRYLKREQKADGSWYGRWGVNYVYGTGAVLLALREAGEDMGESYIQRAVAWSKAHQNQDGGWGESCQSYEDLSLRGIGQSTPSQTAWSLLGLLAAGEGDSRAVRRGIGYLLGTQLGDGTWEEQSFTGTGFPRAFYLRYDLYRISFPLMALARFRRWLEQERAAEPSE
jgi:squalene-hopene/tetraprenyl-beta-curcumene cyclase